MKYEIMYFRAEHEKIGSLRLGVPCMLSGKAAGTAAALSFRQNVQPCSLDMKNPRQAGEYKGINFESGFGI